MKKILFLLFFPFAIAEASAVPLNDTNNVPLNRQVFHDRIKAEQQRADRADGKIDGFIRISNIEEVNQQITDALIRKVNILRNDVEVNPSIPLHNEKIKYLRHIEDLVRLFNNNWRAHKISPTLAPVLVDNFTNIYKANIKGESMAPYINDVPYDVGVINTQIFNENPGYADSRKILFLKYIRVHPDKILTAIQPYADEPFADSLVVMAFQQSPTQLYTYAQATNTVQGKLIARNQDNRIKTLVQISKLKQSLLYFPFLDDLITGKQTIPGIEKYIGKDEAHYDSVGYYKQLVKTEIDYYNRLIHRDTPIAMIGTNGLLDMMQRKAVEHFVNPINDLHEAPNPNVRFKAIEPLNAQELYYMIVLGENDIYTSSYKTAFDKMLSKLGSKAKGDSLLMLVNFDKFKKFIKMAAGYNKLDTFLKTMSPTSSEILMKAFVSNLENTGSLEDAVDVADSYGSIRNKGLLTSMLDNVTANEQRCIDNKNQRGARIYNLLKMIMLSADSSKKVDLSFSIGIPSVYSVAYHRLQNENGAVIEQVFFYGDKDGKESFKSFMTSFPKNQWKVTMTPEWAEIKSLKGHPVWIYANLPLDNETDKDAEAQNALMEYLDTNNLKPAIVIHRGHSYHLPYTIEQLPESAKIIVLGSCGGYKNLKLILDYVPDAHIISTKQIGAKDINKPILEALNNYLLGGESVDWRKMWNSLDAQFSKGPRDKKDLFDDYIPPHKNLGALFIKAYTIMEGREPLNDD